MIKESGALPQVPTQLFRFFVRRSDEVTATAATDLGCIQQGLHIKHMVNRAQQSVGTYYTCHEEDLSSSISIRQKVAPQQLCKPTKLVGKPAGSKTLQPNLRSPCSPRCACALSCCFSFSPRSASTDTQRHGRTCKQVDSYVLTLAQIAEAYAGGSALGLRRCKSSLSAQSHLMNVIR